MSARATAPYASDPTSPAAAEERLPTWARRLLADLRRRVRDAEASADPEPAVIGEMAAMVAGHAARRKFTLA